MAITPNHGIYYPTRDMNVREVRQHITTLASSTDDALQSLVDGYAVVENQADLPASGNYPGRRAWVTSLGYEFVWTGSQWQAPSVPEDVFPYVRGELTRSTNYVLGVTDTIVAFNSWVEPPSGVSLDSNGMRLTTSGLYAIDVFLGVLTSSGANSSRTVINGVPRRRRYLSSDTGSAFRGTWTEHLRLNEGDLVQVNVITSSAGTQLSASSDFTVTRLAP